LLEQLAKELGYLKQANAGGDGPTGPVIDGDLIIKIEKLELKVDGLEKKLANLARAQGAPATVLDPGVDEKRFQDLVDRFENHLRDYNDFKDQIINMLKQL
jgi:hypothetical protein